MRTFSISGYVNSLSAIRYTEKNVPYRSVLIGRGKDEPSYSIMLWGKVSELCEVELVKGAKVRFLQVKVTPDTTQDAFKSSKIANIFTLVATDWIILKDWEKNVQVPETTIENGYSFRGFVNHVKESVSTNDKAMKNLLVGTAGKVSIGVSNFGKNAEKLDVSKGQMIKMDKIGLSPVKDENFTKNNIASHFYISLLEHTIVAKSEGSESASRSEPRTRTYTRDNTVQEASESRQETPPVDNDDSYAQHMAERQTEIAGDITDDDIPF